jgi:hypothetical protein
MASGLQKNFYPGYHRVSASDTGILKDDFNQEVIMWTEITMPDDFAELVRELANHIDRGEIKYAERKAQAYVLRVIKEAAQKREAAASQRGISV